ncbi:class I SAM-dependent methyltransferase [Acetoanaerobium noterae]|uniref:class I SAM-dependent methyltransferase n=1 Tax=Acetoanaerobium noterae TaxID=745369 RepID=UPI00333434A5
MDSWKKGLFQYENTFNKKDNYLIHYSMKETREKHEVWNNNSFDNRSKTKYSTTYIETILLEKKLSDILNKNLIKKNDLVGDFGCADGRITDFLLRQSYNKIISVDYDLDNIITLSNNLKNTHLNNVLPIVSDINKLGMKEEIFDCIIAWGVLSCTDDYDESLKNLEKLIKDQGTLIISEPILEHALIYSLIRNDISEFKKCVETSSRAAYWNDKETRYKVYRKSQIDSFIKNNKNFDLIEMDYISIFPSLIFGGILQEQEHSLEEKEELMKLCLDMDDKSFNFERQVVYVLKKK